MKYIAALAVVMIANLGASADEMPLQNKLPNGGQGCTFEASFNLPGMVCGRQTYDLMTCPNASGGTTRYLVIGHIGSDVLNECSPTRVIDEVLPQVHMAQPTTP